VWRCACAVQGSTTTGQAQAAAERAQGSSANGGAAVQVGGDTSTHHFACMHAGALLISRGARGGASSFYNGERLGLWGGGGGGEVAQLTLSPTAKAEAGAHCLMPPNRPFQLIPGN